MNRESKRGKLGGMRVKGHQTVQITYYNGFICVFIFK